MYSRHAGRTRYGTTCVKPVVSAMALIVSVLETVIEPEYCVEDVGRGRAVGSAVDIGEWILAGDGDRSAG